MAQKPYKHNIEYIQKFYSYGSEAKVLEIKPIYEEDVKLPKKKREKATTIFIDPVALCAALLAGVMFLMMVVSFVQFRIDCQDHAAMVRYTEDLREQNILLHHSYNAHIDLERIETMALALGMIPVEQANTISVTVQVPQPQPEPTLIDDIIWFFSGLLE